MQQGCTGASHRPCEGGGVSDQLVDDFSDLCRDEVGKQLALAAYRGARSGLACSMLSRWAGPKMARRVQRAQQLWPIDGEGLVHGRRPTEDPFDGWRVEQVVPGEDRGSDIAAHGDQLVVDQLDADECGRDSIGELGERSADEEVAVRVALPETRAPTSCPATDVLT